MRPPFQILIRGLASGLALSVTVAAETAPAPAPPPPIKALLVAGGCSHEYETRAKILVQGIRERIVRPMEWVVRLGGAGEGDAKIPLFDSAEWAKGYDLVVHDHCFPRVRDPAYVDRVLAPHRAGTPAVLVHGTMLSFPTPDHRWASFTGAVIRTHERERPVRVEFLKTSDPIGKGFQPWTIPREELYRVESPADGVASLAFAADPAGKRHPVVWTHRFGPAQTRVFATTLGNATATLADPVSLDLLARGALWSLGSLEDCALRTVPPGESLKGLAIPAAAEPLLRPGRNATSRGVANAFQWGQAKSAEGASLALDGDPRTAWKPPGAGPGWWEVRWEKPRRLSLAAVWWEGPAPAEAVLEGSADGRAWTALDRLVPPGSPETPVLARFPAREFAGLRLSVPRTAPGQGFALREVAAYASEDELPSAILAVSPDPTGLVRCRTAGAGELARIRIAPGWELEFLESTGFQGEPGQLLPTASGGLFVSVFPGEEAPGEVRRFDRKEGRGLAEGVYLSGIAPETRIAWDGEWLYTLSGSRLERVRKALGPGPADERQRFGDLFRPSGEGGPVDLEWPRFFLAADGWLRARYRTASPGAVVRSDGRSIALAREGVVRFRRDGSGFSPCDEDGPVPSLDGVAEIEGLLAWERDGDRIWFLVSGSGGAKLGSLKAGSAEAPPRVDLDEAPTERLAGLLAAASGETARREIAFELARRKGDRLPQVAGLLAASPPGALAESLVATVAALPPAAARTHLVALATNATGHPEVRAAAFRALGDFEGGLDPAVFRDLGTVTAPSVTAAIFEGLRRRGATLPGAEEVALRLARHPDSGLARAAFAFLRDRAAVDAAFAALDDPGRREDWPAAFDLLGSLREAAVVESVARRLAATRDADLRRGFLESLCRLRLLRGGERWEKTEEIETRLHETLSDPRVDRAALLAAMERNGFPLEDSETLAALAREIPSLEPYAVARLAELRPPPSAMPSAWLEAVAADPDRDAGLRQLARTLLAPPIPPSLHPPLPPSPPPSAPPSPPRAWFLREGCAACHNLDGEGPSAGPDLVERLGPLPAGEIERVLRNPRFGNAGFPGVRRLETSDGKPWFGWVEEREGETLRLVDLAGNRLALDAASVRREESRPSLPPPCRVEEKPGSGLSASFAEFLERVSNPNDKE